MKTNLSPTLSLFLAILVALLITMVLCILSISIAKRFKLIDLPGIKPHKQHKHPTPIAGGIALILSLLFAEWMVGTFMNWEVRAFFLAVVPVFIFGLYDDFKNISPPIKLVGQLIGVSVLIHQGIYIRIFESPEFAFPIDQNIRIYIDWAATAIWVVGITNAQNFVDSKDGLSVGLAGITAAFFMLMTLDSAQITLSQHSAVILGVCIGLYFFNSPPAILFLGDSGSQTLGFLLAALAIAYHPVGVSQYSSWFVPLLLLGVPIFDSALVIFSRIRRNHPVYLSALDHTYHRLLRLGLGSHRAVLVMQFTSLALGCSAFLILQQPPMTANAAFFSLMIIGTLVLIYLEKLEPWTTLPKNGYDTE